MTQEKISSSFKARRTHTYTPFQLNPGLTALKRAARHILARVEFKRCPDVNAGVIKTRAGKEGAQARLMLAPARAGTPRQWK